MPEVGETVGELEHQALEAVVKADANVDELGAVSRRAIGDGRRQSNGLADALAGAVGTTLGKSTARRRGTSTGAPTSGTRTVAGDRVAWAVG